MPLCLRLFLLSTSLWFVACGTLPQTEVTDDLPHPSTPLSELKPLAEWAAQLPLQQRQHPFIEPDLEPATTTDYIVELAQILFLQAQHEAAANLLQQLALDDLSAEQLRRYAIIQAYNEQALNRPQVALEWLQPPYRELLADLPWSQQWVLNQLQADLYRADGQYLTAAQLRYQLHPLLPTTARQDNLNALWLDIRAISELELHLPYQLGEDWEGWLALVRLERRAAGHLQQLEQDIATWREAYPEHPAHQRLPDALAQLLSDLPQPAQAIALILPLSNDFSGPGQRILAGFLAGYYAAQTHRQPMPILRIYDERSAPPQTLIQLAIDEGAELIIGPLDRRNVAELETLGTLPVPILALNRTARTHGYHPQVIQMALAPEDEAQQVARWARQAGHQVAAMMVPEGEWGERVATAFQETWLGLEGRLVQLQTLPNRDDGRQYLAQVQTILDIAQSQQRARNIEAVLGRSIESEPRPRGDLDLVFLATNPDQTRQIVSLFNFQLADHIQLMAISAAVGDQPSDRDQTLSGLQVVETPWRLTPHPLHSSIQSAQEPGTPVRFDRLHALGLDAWQLVAFMPALSERNGFRWHGQTGLLTLNEQNQLVRELTPAEFQSHRLIPSSSAIPPEALLRGPLHEPTTWQ